METPSSTTRRITRSQTKAGAASVINTAISMSIPRKNKRMESKQRNEKRDRSTALIDITNGSPIVGVAMGNSKTPSLSQAKKKKKKDRPILTPCSGESILRGQVKTLLKKKVGEEEEEEEDGVSNFSLVHHHPFFFNLQKFVDSHPNNNSSRVVLGPTPHVLNHLSNGDLKEVNLSSWASVKSIHQLKEDSKITQGVVTMEGSRQAGSHHLESQKSLISRTLLFEFSDEKSEDHSSSMCSNHNILTYDQEKIKSNDDDHQQEEGDTSSGSMMMIDELCEGVRQISVNENGKHIRFVYSTDEDDDNDDEEEDEEEEEEEREISFISWGSVTSSSLPSTGILRLKGIPTPIGKHLRFHIDEEDDEQQEHD